MMDRMKEMLIWHRESFDESPIGKGLDLDVNEFDFVQTELVAISATVNGVLPVIGRSTVDSAHNPGYAAGYLYDKVKPRIAMTTHMGYDAYSKPGAACRDPLSLQGAVPLRRARHVGGQPDARQSLGTRWRGTGLPEHGAAEVRHRRDGWVGHSGAPQQAPEHPGAVDSRRRDLAQRLLPEGLQAGADSVLAHQQARLHTGRTSAAWLVAEPQTCSRAA
jgi:hypothetical protein